MAILDTILDTPIKISTLEKPTLEMKLDCTFANLLYYAKLHWSYVASSTSGGDALLAGTAVSAPCGGIAKALRSVFIDGLGVADTDIEYVTVAGYLWTGPGYSSFDPKVHGNLRRLDTPGEYRNGCIFNQHFYLKCNGKYYDPCLSTSYAVRDQSVKDRFDANTASFSLGTDRRRLMITADKKTCILYMPQEQVAGFQGAYAMFDATKKNLEAALGSAYFKAEMAAKHGADKFQNFVRTLR